MAVISVSIKQSNNQIISGIPQSITISTNIPCSIFYTLDGTDPTLLSNIYTSAIYLPTDLSLIILKVFATNGIDSSPIILEKYQTNILNDTRLPHSGTTEQPKAYAIDQYPFGSSAPQPNTEYKNPADSGLIVDDPNLSQISGGYDGSGNPNNFTNLPFNVENYDIKYSTTDSIGQTGRGIGTLPGNVKIELEKAPPEESKFYTQLFDPKAMVIFQDESLEDKELPPLINRQYFTLERHDRVRDGNDYYNYGLDAKSNTGSFLRSHYNPRTNEICYYFYDSLANRWIISKSQFTPNGTYDGNLAIQFLGRKGKTNGLVLPWRTFTRRVLF